MRSRASVGTQEWGDGILFVEVWVIGHSMTRLVRQWVTFCDHHISKMIVVSRNNRRRDLKILELVDGIRNSGALVQFGASNHIAFAAGSSKSIEILAANLFRSRRKRNNDEADSISGMVDKLSKNAPDSGRDTCAISTNRLRRSWILAKNKDVISGANLHFQS